MAEMEPVRQTRASWVPAELSEIDWFTDGKDTWAGIPDLPFGDAIWILSAMYIGPGDPERTHDDDYRELVEAGEIVLSPTEQTLSDGATVAGGGIGRSESPGPEWRRLRWAEAAARTGDPLILPGTYSPCYLWLPSMHPNGSWPSNVIPPSDGSLDRDSWTRLVEVLIAASPEGPETPCFAFFCAAMSPTGDPSLLRGRLGDAIALYDHPSGDGNPANLWPADHSWLTWSDYDNWGTRVGGPATLLSALEADDELETVRLPDADARHRSA